MRAEIISVGTELLLGDIVNTNAQFLAQELATLGFEVYYQSVVGDNPMRLRSLIQTAKDRSDLLLFTGGLGPTEDDLTKETVADMYGDTLVMDESELASIEEFFAQRGLVMTENNRKQAMVPKKGHKLPNDNGTAPGAFFRQGNKYALLLPGPPKEMKPMFLQQVRPLLEVMQDGSIRSLTLRVFGIGESELENKVFDLLVSSNPTAALYAKTGEVHIRITARAQSAGQADVMCAEYAALFRKILGDVVYSEEGLNLEETVVRLLREKKESLATAESCTGGLLSERITSVPGASDVFGFGATTYADAVKRELLRVRRRTLRLHGAVSSQVAAEMAFGAQDRGVADYGIGITGVAGPDGGTEEKPVGLVYVALAKSRQVFVKRLRLPGRGRENVRWMATQHALDMLRRAAQNLPISDAKEYDRTQHADYERVGKPRKRGGTLRRGLVALLVVVLLFAGILLGVNAGKSGQTAAHAGAPSAQGLRYGTPAYTAAACALVAKEAQTNPSVVAFLAMPGGTMEQLVGRSNVKQTQLQNPDKQPGMKGMAALPLDDSIAKAGGNTLLLGADGLAGLHAFRDTDRAQDISTFTYYTARDARVYQVFSLLIVDENETRRDGFTPAVSDLSGYQNYLTFILGSKIRSLYDIPAELTQNDSYMSVSAIDPKDANRRFVLMGRLQRPEEKQGFQGATPAGAALMPAAWYAHEGSAAPDEDMLWTYAMRRYLGGGVTNTMLQTAAGMPQQDKVPLVPVPRAASLAVSSSKAQEEESAVSSPQGSSVGQALGNAGAFGAQVRLLTAIDVSRGGEFSPRTSAPKALLNKGASSSSSSASQEVSSSSLGLSSAIISSSSPASSVPPVPSSAPGSSLQSVGSAPGAGSSVAQSESVAESVAASSVVSVPLPRPAGKRGNPDVLTVRMNGEVITASVIDVLSWICQSECGWMDEAAIKAQAIAAHSWILNQQGAGNTVPQVVGALPSAQVRAAVEQVAGSVLSENGEAPAFTPYYPMAANATNTPETIWGGTRAYLSSVSSVQEQSRDDWRQIVTLPKQEVAQMLFDKAGVSLTDIAEASSWFSDFEKNEGGYVISLKAGDTKITGVDFWQRILFSQGRVLLRSPAFEIEFDGENFVFTTYGQGHGCGMSQTGMGALAREGWSHTRILAHYYPGTELITWE